MSADGGTGCCEGKGCRMGSSAATLGGERGEKGPAGARARGIPESWKPKLMLCHQKRLPACSALPDLQSYPSQVASPLPLAKCPPPGRQTLVLAAAEWDSAAWHRDSPGCLLGSPPHPGSSPWGRPHPSSPPRSRRGQGGWSTARNQEKIILSRAALRLTFLKATWEVKTILSGPKQELSIPALMKFYKCHKIRLKWKETLTPLLRHPGGEYGDRAF